MRGVTLLELVVVLAIVGLGTALVAPALLPPTPSRQTLATVTAAARALAVSRAQTLQLSVQPDGRWSLTELPPLAEVLAQGTLNDTGVVALRVHLTPLGACMMEAGRAVVPGWDAARCAAPPSGPSEPTR